MTDRPIVRVLGPVRFPDGGGALIAPAGAMPRRLLVALALAGPEGRGVAGLTEDLWPDEPPRNPRGAIQMLVSRLRAVAAEGLLASTPTGYRVSGSDLEAAERADAAAAAAALALWTGDAGSDLEADALADDLVARAERARLRLLRLEAQRLLDERRGDEAVPLLERVVDGAPLDGDAVLRLMRAQAEGGRVDAALAAFAAHRERLADALGADPDPALVRLNAELLRAQAAPTAADLVGVRAATTPLLGRQDDLERLTATVPTHRLTSIVGTGGLGKTRLAHESALRLADRFERIVFTELAGAPDAEGVELVVGTAVGARGTRTRRLADPLPADLGTRTREALAARRTLLVLDNCEHVVDAAAQLAVDLLAAVPDLTVLATSRVPLLVPGEAVVAPQPLPADGSAADLFVERARAARPGVPLDPALVERVCARLDGLPLAIELAAARLRSMTLPELDRRLEDRFAVLVGGDRTAPDRHRTLLAVIEWSRRLLSPAAAAALSALAVFPDGFTAAGADLLLGRDASAELTELVDQSLLAFTEQGPGRARYRMLETVREYGLRDLAERGALEQARTALDAWAVAFARGVAPGLLGGRDPAATRTVTEEEETLLAVLRSGGAGREPVLVAVAGLLMENWMYRGEFEPLAAILPELLGAAALRPRTGQEQEDALKALTIAASVAQITGSPAVLRALALLRRATRRGAPATGFWGVFATSLVLAPSLAAGTAAIDALADSPDPLSATFARLMRAQLEENRGLAEAAIADLAAADALAARNGFHWVRFLARTSIASLRSQQGRHEEALATAERVRAEIVALDLDTELRQLDWLIGANRAALGDLDAAEALFGAMAGATGRAGAAEERDNRAIAEAGLAEVATARGDRAAALPRWETALATARRASPPWRVLVDASALAARVRLGVPAADLAEPYRRLRVLLIVVLRLGPLGFDAPVLGAGMLGLAAVLRRTAPEAADGLLGAALAFGARRDMASLDLVAAEWVGPPPPVEVATGQALALLRSPAVRQRG
ncbi:BTAD domain-containing putative transcriptional regulator [Amnibacterium soli]|uniref:BTAD domain-containing putative transcriptional regulator n=1 Tax=Amnibacterium soli TaxID=1282736 RepID=A0ABP8Z0P1_9MICO